jgi:hypothetical protein
MRWLAAVVAIGCGGRDPEPAYEGCNLDDPEVVCAEGTACVESAIIASGNGWCSTSCVPAADDCPAGPEGLGAACHQPDGAAEAQCYVECPADELCPLSTTCVAFDEGGVEVKLCVPR